MDVFETALHDMESALRLSDTRDVDKILVNSKAQLMSTRTLNAILNHKDFERITATFTGILTSSNVYGKL